MMRNRGSISQASGVLPKRAIVFFVLLVVLGALTVSKPLWASLRNQPCIGTREQWEQHRRDVEKKLAESRQAETDMLLGSRGFGRGVPTFSYPGASAGGGSDHPPGSVGDMQYRAGSWTNPHRPGASSRRDYERQMRELRDLNSYLLRCFPDEEPDEDIDEASEVEMPCRPMLNPLFFMKCDEPTHKGRDCYYGPGRND